MAEKIMGTDYTPPDLIAKVTGKARYAEDHRAEGMLFAKLLLSPMPHCRVKNIDATEALKMEGVEAILLPKDIPGYEKDKEEGNYNFKEYCLSDEPLYEGQPILAIAAVDELTAADAIEKIKIEYEPLEFALDPLLSLRPGGPNALEGGNTIVRERNEEGQRVTKAAEVKWTQEDFDSVEEGQMPIPASLGDDEGWTIGDLDAGFAEADYTLDETVYHQSLSHHPMEPRTCMAYWRGDKLFLHPSTQSVGMTAATVGRSLGVDAANLTLINEYTGGGFGSKITATVNVPIAVMLAKKTGRPVMQRVTRYEENYYGRARPGFQARFKMGFRKDGKLVALDSFIVQDNGPYGSQGDVNTAGNIASLAYTPTNMRHRTVSILTNTPPRAAQRAPGGAQIITMLEPLFAKAARELGVDKMEMKRINAPTPESKLGPRQSDLTSIRAREALDLLAKLVNWDEVKGLSGKRVGSKVTGIGVSLSTYTAGASGYDGLMIVRPDGKLHIHTGVGNLGTHSYSDTARAACDVLGFPWDDVVMVWGDSSKGLPWTTVQAGSMSTFTTTRAIHAAATDLRTKLTELAAEELGGAAADYDVDGGRVFSTADATKALTFAEASTRAIARGGKYAGAEPASNLNGMTKASVALLAGQGLIGAAKDTYERKGSVYSFVAGYARIELDTETGVVDVLDYATTVDCGTVMNPRSLAAQLHGGGVQGMGAAHSQNWIYDRKWGVPFAHRFYSSRPPTMLDVPLEMKADFVDMPDPMTPVGAKGVGEPPVGAGAGALASAIHDAMGGMKVTRTPIMTDMLVNLIEQDEQPFSLSAHV